MLGILLSNSYVYYLMGVIFATGIIIKALTGGRLNGLAKDVREMNKSNHPFLKLVKAKFEHAYMANGEVQNIEVFVDKFMREIKVCGLTVHRWSKVKLFLVLLLLLVGGVSSARAYNGGIEEGIIFEQVAVAITLAILMLGTYYTVDEKYRLRTIRIYMVDYLENVMSKRLEKNYSKNELHTKEVAKKYETAHKEDAITETTSEMFQINEEKFQTSTAGVTLEQVQESEPIVNKKLEVTQLFSAESNKDRNKDEMKKTKILPNIEKELSEQNESDGVDNVKTPNAAMLREILQEFMA